ncbi:MAG: hypothetical protein Q9217_002020 [Psora testacea]
MSTWFGSNNIEGCVCAHLQVLTPVPPQIQQLQLPASDADGYGPAPNIGVLAFDNHEELLWVGDYHGRVTSFIGAQLERYTSIRAHEESEGQVLQFLFNEKGVVSIASASVHFMIRRGLTQWNTNHPSMRRICCMTFIDRGASLLVAGNQNVMLKVDTGKGQVVEEIVSRSEYTMMKHGRYICAATNSGSVDFFEPTTLNVVKTWQAHTASISDMEVSGNSLITCGRSLRQHGPAMLETFAKVYDMKTMHQLPPIPFPAAAAFVQVHPRLSNTCVLGAQNGQLQVVDLVNPNTSNMVVLGSFITHFLMSPSGNIWAVADQENMIHLWGSPNKPPTFNDVVQMPEYADDIEPVQHISIDEDVPFSTIGMPYYRERLLSAWGNEQPWEVGYLLPKLDSDVEKSLRASAGFGRFAPNPEKGLRNQANRTRLGDADAAAFPNPKFLSEKAKELENGHGEDRRISDAAEALAGLSFSGATREDVHWYYMNVKIKYGKYGVADFDFRAYNNTTYSGLETDISNSYLNPLLQLIKYTPIIRNQALHHVAGSCLDEDCLLCELGFLCDMLEKAGGEVCQAANFLKIFGSNAEAASLNILEDQAPQSSLDVRLSAANRFFLNKITQNSRKFDPPEFSLDRLLTLNAQMTMRCLNCHNETFRRAPSLMMDLIYPDLHAATRGRAPAPRFADVLKMSFSASSQSKGYCKHCRRYPQLSNRRAVIELPSVLVLDAALDRSPKSSVQLWSNAGWLPEEIGITIHPGGDIVCHEGDNLQRFRHHHNVILYELVGLVADVSSMQGQKSHLVSFVNVAISEPLPQYEAERNNWHLFNDFLVRKVDKQEALRFVPSWKMPVVLSYQMKAYRHAVDHTWKSNPDITCLYNEGSLKYPRNNDIGFALRPGLEIPQPGFHLAIDAEFVSLEQEEIEIKIDGTIEVIRPVRQGTGRISALRGSGLDEGIPFIDDYIKIDEPIVDHLTQFSGLSAGDLDPRRSTHALQPLKIAYKKLWLLLNLGCTFVGHGLASDFRTINIHIPKSQIVDTVTLFRPPNEKRRLSLRFLAWYFLEEEIQTGNHDSIVDALTALRLWRKHQEFVETGVLDQKLMEIYRDGPNTAFKPPAEFEAQGGKIGRSRRRIGGTDNSLLGGRMTPEMQVESVASSAVGTPMGKGRREGEGYFGSPLK